MTNVNHHTGIKTIAITTISRFGAPAPPGGDGSPPAGPRAPWVHEPGSDCAGGSAEEDECRRSIARIRRAATERTTAGHPITETDAGLDGCSPPNKLATLESRSRLASVTAGGGQGFVLRDRSPRWRGVVVAPSLRRWVRPTTVEKGLGESAGVTFPADSGGVCRDPGSLDPVLPAAEFCDTEGAL